MSSRPPVLGLDQVVAQSHRPTASIRRALPRIRARSSRHEAVVDVMLSAAAARATTRSIAALLANAADRLLPGSRAILLTASTPAPRRLRFRRQNLYLLMRPDARVRQVRDAHRIKFDLEARAPTMRTRSNRPRHEHVRIRPVGPTNQSVRAPRWHADNLTLVTVIPTEIEISVDVIEIIDVSRMRLWWLFPTRL